MYVFLGVVSNFATKAEIKSYEYKYDKRVSLAKAKADIKANYERDVYYGSLKYMKDIAVTLEVIEL